MCHRAPLTGRHLPERLPQHDRSTCPTSARRSRPWSWPASTAPPPSATSTNRPGNALAESRPRHSPQRRPHPKTYGRCCEDHDHVRPRLGGPRLTRQSDRRVRGRADRRCARHCLSTLRRVHRNLRGPRAARRRHALRRQRRTQRRPQRERPARRRGLRHGRHRPGTSRRRAAVSRRHRGFATARRECCARRLARDSNGCSRSD